MNLWPTRGCLLAQEAATTEASGEVAVAWRSKGRPPGAGRGAEAAIHMEKSLGEETEWRSDLFVRSGSVSGRGEGAIIHTRIWRDVKPKSQGQHVILWKVTN
jgi:hypothetical protein